MMMVSRFTRTPVLAMAILAALPAEAQRPAFPSQILSQQIDSGVTAPVVGDFTGDRIPDLVIHLPQEIRVYPADGKGGFAAPVVTPLGATESRRYRRAAATGDFNRDGKLDYFAYQRVYLGNGDGTLTLAATIDIEDQPQVADLDGDGIPDLSGVAAGNRFLVILGSEDGTFCPPAMTQCKPWREWKANKFAVLGDVNLDARPDLVTVSPEGRIVTTLSAIDSGDPGAVSYTRYSPSGVVSIALADVTGDGFPDLIVASVSITVSPGLGNGKFDDSYVVATGNRTGYFERFHDVIAADFNGDGRMDLGYIMIYDEPVDGFEVGILYGDGQGKFSPLTMLRDGFLDITYFNLGDWNGDGLPDLVFGDTKRLCLALSTPQALSTASGDPAVAPGSLAEIHGLNLASAEVAVPQFAALPKTLGGVSVLLDDGSSPFGADLLYVSPSRVNFRMPVAWPSGWLSGRVVGPGGKYEFSLWVQPQAPGIFTTDGTHAVAAIAASYTTVDVMLYATGLNRAPASETTVVVNGKEITAESLFSMPGLAGLDLVGAAIPRPVVCRAAGPCPNAFVQIKVGGFQSKTVLLDLRSLGE